MKFTKIRDLRYINSEESVIDLFCTSEELGEIEMTLNLKDAEDIHTYFDGDKEYPLEEYCKKQKIKSFEPDNKLNEEKRILCIKIAASRLITEKYPEFKQLNIIRTGGEELKNMSAYIDKIREISNMAEKNKTELKDIIWDVL